MHKAGLPSSERSAPKPTMRKYYQLALVIVSAVSVVSLLFYRHEYNRLRYVLEVLNFFGKPGQTTIANDCAPLNITHHLEGITTPLPTWQRVSDTHFVYSAFWEKSEHGKQVKAISLQFGKRNPKFNCHLWYEDRGEPVLGKFSFSLIESKEGINNDFKLSKSEAVNAYYLYCKPQESTGVPYGTAFYKTDDLVPSKLFIPIHNIEEKAILENSTAVCIAPSQTPGLPKSMVVEFLSYHQLVGINDFVVYDSVLPSKVQMVLQNKAVQDRFGLSLAWLPWAFPFPSLEAQVAMRLVVEKDCILRATGKFHNVAVLAWNEYIVPRFHHSLSVMLNNFDSGKKTTSRFAIPTIIFCTELDDDENAEASSPLVLRKTRYSKGSGVDIPFHVYRPLLMSALTTQRMSQGIVAVHRYIQCSKEDAQKSLLAEVSQLVERPMLRFAEDLKRSKLIKAWYANKLFD